MSGTRSSLVFGASALLIVFSLFSISVLIGPSVSAQNENAVFQISSADFTVKDLPLKGEPYTIPKELTVWNRDDNERLVNFESRVPSPEKTTAGYVPIPNENWVSLVPSSLMITENSSETIQISLNLPNWDNLTGKKWEVWITAERQPIGAEEFIIEHTSRMKMETVGATGASDGDGGFPVLWILVSVIIIAAIAVVVWWLTKGRTKKKSRRGMLSRSWR